MVDRFYNNGAVLSCDFITNDIICLGGLDCCVKLYLYHFVISCVGMTIKRNTNAFWVIIILLLVVLHMWNLLVIIAY